MDLQKHVTDEYMSRNFVQESSLAFTKWERRIYDSSDSEGDLCKVYSSGLPRFKMINWRCQNWYRQSVERDGGEVFADKTLEDEWGKSNEWRECYNEGIGPLGKEELVDFQRVMAPRYKASKAFRKRVMVGGPTQWEK